MPSLSPPTTRPLSRRTTRLLIAVSVLAALVALPRAHASTTPAPAPTVQAAASSHPPVAVAAPTPIPAAKPAKATTVASNAPTCHAIMQRLSGSLAATPSTADKPGTVMIDVDKAGVMMACSHSDSVAIPVPGSKAK
ncbi:glycoprotein [Ralstonia pickettii]|uniref:Glycoprotein n=1 Tax=Ralstonia pickettii TaxID=329 RepID=A0A2N4TQ88_RALPI|nr:glycoprotein [Ralstonia pickettii]PLC41867.1 glycoprotein [Ralstonia pickettii]